MQFIRRLKRKKGFTITELIVVVALVGIMMATLTAFSGPVREMVLNTRASNDVLTVNNIIGNYLEHNLSYASQVSICAGWDIAANRDKLDSMFTDLKNKWKTANDRPGVIIIHYEKDADSPLRNTFRLYEYSKDDAFPSISLTDPSTVTMNDDNLVFHKDFYDDYSFVITADDLIFLNNYREKAYVRINVNAFKFDGAIMKAPGVEASLEAGDTLTHYMNIDGAAPIGGGTGIQTDKLTASYFQSAGVGTENVFFPLQNINVADCKFEYLRGNTESGATTYGDDIVIFYNIRTYNYGKTSS